MWDSNTCLKLGSFKHSVKVDRSKVEVTCAYSWYHGCPGGLGATFSDERQQVISPPRPVYKERGQRENGHHEKKAIDRIQYYARYVPTAIRSGFQAANGSTQSRQRNEGKEQHRNRDDVIQPVPTSVAGPLHRKAKNDDLQQCTYNGRGADQKGFHFPGIFHISGH
jgi:hypothetical protein